jgi:asparagine synthase (glutamine-hydrolysing)
MCGIAGLLDPGWSGTDEELARLAAAMAETLAHRGPDDEGTWCDARAGIGLGHRRLAVIDLSPAGHQPFVSADGRWIISYNGECYNAAELRNALPDRGRSLKGHCDTEVVVEAVAAWGLRPTLERLDAMFALALWDRRDRVLHLVRDRLGEKPLYYAMRDGVMLFGSELRALLAYPQFNREIDRRALALLLRLNYIPAPLTIFTGARKLAAGTFVSVRAGERGWPRPEVWWDFSHAARTAISARPPKGDDKQGALGQLETVIAESVSRRMVADVPVGTFLSGGIDSTLVAALAQVTSSGPVRTFTVGFAGQGGDESNQAEAVARHLGTAHNRIDLTSDDALSLVPHLGRYYDEPFADPSQLPTILMCLEAKRHVTVALSGDGGDEGFGGYRRYTAGAAITRRVLPLPRGLRRVAAGTLQVVPGGVWATVERGVRRVRPNPAGSDVGARAQKLGRLLSAGSSREVYMSLVSAWDDAETVVLGAADLPWSGPPPTGLLATPAEEMMAWDTLSTLPDEMLVKVDRASMAFGLEVRPPLVGHKVVEAAWALPSSLRIDGGVGKRALRLLVERYVPRHLTNRPKTGFDPPLGTWLRGPLRNWAEDLLAASRLKAEGYLDPAKVRTSWDAYQAGRPGLDYPLWAVLAFEAWLEEMRATG